DQQLLGAPLLGLIFGWEKYGSWYYGDYFPPQEGWNAFDAGIQAGKQNGNRWWVFPSPNFLVTATDLWKSGNLQSSAILDAKGNFIMQEIEPGRVRVHMDPSAPAWQAQVIGDYTQLAQHGIDLIQLDGFPVTATPGCFNTAHGHPL